MKNGGPCEYLDEKGYIKVIAFGETVNTNIQVVFNFYSDIRIRYVDAIYVALDCAASIKAGDSINCVRRELISGSCNTEIYEFDSTTCLFQQ